MPKLSMTTSLKRLKGADAQEYLDWLFDLQARATAARKHLRAAEAIADASDRPGLLSRRVSQAAREVAAVAEAIDKLPLCPVPGLETERPKPPSLSMRRSMEALAVLSGEEEPLSARKLAPLLGKPPKTVSVYMTTLEGLRYVNRPFGPVGGYVITRKGRAKLDEDE